MKCDDDTFARVDTVLKEIDGISLNESKSLYMGNLNLLHRPLRSGKWAVSFEVPDFLGIRQFMIYKIKLKIHGITFNLYNHYSY